MSRLTNFPNGVGGFLVDNNAELKTSAYTVVITTDSGKTFTVEADQTFTLPAIAIGNTFTFVNNAPDGTATLTISPNASDGITYAGSSTDNKDLINTGATAKRGDFVTLASLDGTVAWQVTAARGIWAKEA
jgi:hypothetical protein